ncbi:FAD-binding oxidoreductase [Cellulomonas sp. KH9]|uniref:FAD-binding oxidoreductase n=1 Tax=Cellulomonas sp. KH9 TaxID=1855324 RepID=UPI0008EA0DC2|nr:FAD-binding oxidoreductase [Cellulomonas sp. KH9]SFJ84127.1 Ferredoxin-NADP reductase [Cellulomonas sp. KH9]
MTDTAATATTPGPAPLGERFACAGGWCTATVVDARPETATSRTLVLDVPGWPGHRAGQHVDLRLTAADGYTASRAYSVSAPTDPGAPGRVEVTVQRVTGGEVSPYLVDDLPLGAGIEVRGPVGGWFVWEPGTAGGAPVLLLAGGSGVAPLVAMVRARRAAGDRTPFRVLYSVRMPTDALFLDELTAPLLDGVDTEVWFTRAAPPDAPRAPARIGLRDLARHGWPADVAPVCYVCGPTGFVEAMTRMLLVLGHDPRSVRAERFGPSTD